MEFPGQTLVDVLILVLASTYTIFATVHIMLLWHMRNNFFIVLRSPLLACISGLGTILRYIFSTFLVILEGGEAHHDDNIDLIMMPAVWIAEAALVLTAVRLWVMYYPSKRAKYGRYTNERRLTWALVCSYMLIETLAWSGVAALGKERAVGVVSSLGPLPALLTIIAAMFFGWKLKDVHDFSNMGRDIRLVGATMVASFPIYLTLKLFLRSGSLEAKYGNVVFLAISHTSIVWILTIRPVKEILRQEPGRMLMLPFRRGSRNISRVAITAGVEKGPGQRGRASCGDANRLVGIMGFVPLRVAFGNFCNKSLCSESFQFLVDVFEFKNELLLLEAGSDERARTFKGFGGYLAIVNDYIKDGSHSEVNIDSRTKRDILAFATFNIYSSLDTNGRTEIFSAAEKEISKMLVDNLLNKFMLSSQYKAVVELG